MKLNKTTILSTIAIFLVVVIFVQPTQLDLPPKTHQVVDWTRNKVNAFLSKYYNHLGGYDKKHVDQATTLLVKKVNECENAAKNTHNNIARNLGAKVDVFINAIKIRLEQQHNLSEQDLDDLVNTIQHNFQQLEQQGQWTGDKIGQAIDQVQRQMAHKKTITEAFWNSIKNDVRSQLIGTYHHPSLLQRVLSAVSPSSYLKKSTSLGSKSSLDQWLEQVRDILVDLKVLNENQLQLVMDQLQQTIIKKNINRLATSKWYHHLYGQLNRKGEMTEKQMDGIKNTLEREIDAYRVFVSKGIDNRVDQRKQWLGGIYDYGCDFVGKVKDWIDTPMAR